MCPRRSVNDRGDKCVSPRKETHRMKGKRWASTEENIYHESPIVPLQSAPQKDNFISPIWVSGAPKCCARVKLAHFSVTGFWERAKTFSLFLVWKLAAATQSRLWFFIEIAPAPGPTLVLRDPDLYRRRDPMWQYQSAKSVALAPGITARLCLRKRFPE